MGEQDDLARFGASEAAGYLYPGEDQQRERDAYREGAAYAASRNEQPEQRQAVIQKLSEVAHAIGWQSGVGATEVAGLFVSVLAANPDLIERFMVEGAELMIEGLIKAENGCLSYFAQNGDLLTAARLRQLKGSPDA